MTPKAAAAHREALGSPRALLLPEPQRRGFIINPPRHGPLIPRLVMTKPTGEEDGKKPGARSRGSMKTWRPEEWPKPTACLST